MKRRLVVATSLLFCLSCVFFSSSFAQDTAKQRLETRFENKVFFIRGFYRDNKLVYDAAGNIQGTPAVGPWTLGLVEVNKVEVRSGEFVLEGKRAAEFYDRDKKQFMTTLPKNPESVKITVKVASPESLSDEALDNIRDRIFETRVSAGELPGYWGHWFGKTGYGLPASYEARTPESGTTVNTDGRSRLPNTPVPPSDPIAADNAAEKPTAAPNGGDQPSARAIAASVPTSGSDGKETFRPGVGGVLPPRVLYKVDPKYEELARQSRYQGTTLLSLILDKQGIPQHIQVVRPLGMGLDDKAVEAVSTWRFSPAMRNGVPVAVFIQVEVNFRLF